MADPTNATNARFPALRFAAMLKAARDFGLDQGVVNAIAVRFDARRPELAQVAEALADALLCQDPLGPPDAA